MKERAIFIYVNDGFAHRYLLQSDIFSVLKSNKDLKIIILSHNANEGNFKNHYKSQNVEVEQVDYKGYESYLSNSKLQRILILLRAHVLNGKGETTTVDDFKKILLIQNRWTLDNGVVNFLIGISFRFITAILKASSLLRKMLIIFEQFLLTPNHHQNLFDQYKPELVIVTGLTGFLYNEFIARSKDS